MILKDYTPEVFIDNYIKDRSILGEDVKCIYEEIFSTILNKNIKLDSLEKLISEQEDIINENGLDDYANKQITADLSRRAMEAQASKGFNEFAASQAKEAMDAGKKIFSTPAGLDSVGNALNNSLGSKAITNEKLSSAVKEIMNIPGGVGTNTVNSLKSQIGGAEVLSRSLKTATPYVPSSAGMPSDVANKLAGNTGKGFLASIGKFLSGLKEKVVSFFGGLKGKSFSEILGNGVSWIKNPANLPAILGTTGGVVLLAMIIKALKKKGELNKYKNLQAVASQQNALKEDIDSSEGKQRDAFAKVLDECENNIQMRKLILTENVEKKEYSNDLFGY